MSKKICCKKYEGHLSTYEEKILGKNKIGNNTGIWIIFDKTRGRYLCGVRDTTKAETLVHKLNDLCEVEYEMFEVPIDCIK